MISLFFERSYSQALRGVFSFIHERLQPLEMQVIRTNLQVGSTPAVAQYKFKLSQYDKHYR